MQAAAASLVNRTRLGQSLDGKANVNDLINDVLITGNKSEIATVTFNKGTSFNENDVDSSIFQSALTRELDTIEIVILDLKNVTFTNSVFIGQIDVLRKALNASGRKFGIVVPEGQVRTALINSKLIPESIISNDSDGLLGKLKAVEVGDLKPIMVAAPTEEARGRTVAERITPFKDLVEGNPVIQNDSLTLSFIAGTKLVSDHAEDFYSYIDGRLENNTFLVLDLTNVDNINDDVIAKIIELYQRKNIQTTFTRVHPGVRHCLNVCSKVSSITIEETTS